MATDPEEAFKEIIARLDGIGAVCARLTAIEQALGLGAHNKIPEGGILTELRLSRESRSKMDGRLLIIERRDNLSKSGTLWKVIGIALLASVPFVVSKLWESWVPQPAPAPRAPAALDRPARPQGALPNPSP